VRPKRPRKIPKSQPVVKFFEFNWQASRIEKGRRTFKKFGIAATTMLT
jgi:hypothetical protein